MIGCHCPLGKSDHAPSPIPTANAHITPSPRTHTADRGGRAHRGDQADRQGGGRGGEGAPGKGGAPALACGSRGGRLLALAPLPPAVQAAPTLRCGPCKCQAARACTLRFTLFTPWRPHHPTQTASAPPHTTAATHPPHSPLPALQLPKKERAKALEERAKKLQERDDQVGGLGARGSGARKLGAGLGLRASWHAKLCARCVCAHAPTIVHTHVHTHAHGQTHVPHLDAPGGTDGGGGDAARQRAASAARGGQGHGQGGR